MRFDGRGQTEGGIVHFGKNSATPRPARLGWAGEEIAHTCDNACYRQSTASLSHNLAIMKFRFRAPLLAVVISLAVLTATGKIAPPRPVAPVESNGVRYSADRDGKDQYVIATDIPTGNELWKVKVFHTRIKPWIEEDVQWVFITDLKIVNDSLFVKDGKARCYEVEVKTRRVSKVTCVKVFADGQSSAK